MSVGNEMTRSQQVRIRILTESPANAGEYYRAKKETYSGRAILCPIIAHLAAKMQEGGSNLVFLRGYLGGEIRHSGFDQHTAG
jgi:hypothetical protein